MHSLASRSAECRAHEIRLTKQNDVTEQVQQARTGLHRLRNWVLKEQCYIVNTTMYYAASHSWDLEGGQGGDPCAAQPSNTGFCRRMLYQ